MCLQYADVRSNVAVMNLRRAAAADTTPNAKAPGRTASVDRPTRITGDMTVADALRAGGLRALMTKEMTR